LKKRAKSWQGRLEDLKNSHTPSKLRNCPKYSNLAERLSAAHFPCLKIDLPVTKKGKWSKNRKNQKVAPSSENSRSGKII